LLAGFKLLSIIKKGILFILGPFKVIGMIFLRFIFYKFIVKGYQLYVGIINKLGWSHFKKKSILFVFSQKPLHVTVAFLTIVLVFNNAVSKTQAETAHIDVNKTILADLISSEFAGIEEEQLIEEFFDQEAVISSLQQRYLENLTALNIQPLVDVNVLDVDDEELLEEIENETIVKEEKPKKLLKPKEKRTKVIKYVVKSGDTISTIARKFDITVSTILWENNLNAYSIIRPGDKLDILPASGISYKIARGDTLSRIAQLYDIEEKDIMKANGIENANKIKIGQRVIIPGGKKRYVAQSSKRYSGLQAIRDIVKPANAQARPGVKMQWPAVCHRITQYYSWRHKGLDVACKKGTALYAADAGIVEYSGWGRGYGKQVLLNHGGGKKTRYAHATKLYVKKGQRVSKGETIAAMGSTGWSTGPHIHFEVIINNKKYNPLNYIR